MYYAALGNFSSYIDIYDHTSRTCKKITGIENGFPETYAQEYRGMIYAIGKFVYSNREQPDNRIIKFNPST